jgi:phosphohistidine swiveling domain-containing protein
MDKSEIPEDAVKYVALLTGMQVVYNAQLELKKTRYYQDNVRKYSHEAIKAMEFSFKKDHAKLWKIDEKRAADLMLAVHKIAQLIVEDNGIGIHAIATILRKDVDLGRIVVKELTDEEILEYQKGAEEK